MCLWSHWVYSSELKAVEGATGSASRRSRQEYVSNHTSAIRGSPGNQGDEAIVIDPSEKNPQIGHRLSLTLPLGEVVESGPIDRFRKKLPCAIHTSPQSRRDADQ